MKHQPNDYYLTIETHTKPITQLAIGAVIAIVMTAVFYGFLFGTQL